MARHGGFTLLEAVLALVILSGATMAMLSIRAQAMVASEHMQVQQRTERDAQAVFDLFIAGTLGSPDWQSEESGEAHWRGSLGIEGARRYTVRRSPEVVENPVRAQMGEAVAREVVLWRYEIEIDNQTVVFLWHR